MPIDKQKNHIHHFSIVPGVSHYVRNYPKTQWLNTAAITLYCIKLHDSVGLPFRVVLTEITQEHSARGSVGPEGPLACLVLHSGCLEGGALLRSPN